MTAPSVRPEDIPIPDWMRSHLRSHGPDGVVCVDGAGTVLGWNEGLITTLDGEADPHWILKPLGSLVGWTDLGPQNELFERAHASGSARSTALVRVSETASEWTAELTAVRASEPGEARCFFVYIRRVPEGVQSPAKADDPGMTQPEIKLSRGMMELQVQNRMLMGRAGGLILVVDPEWGTVLHANEYSQEYFRVPVSKARGQRVADLVESVEGFTSNADADVWNGRTVKEVELTFPGTSGNAWVVACVCSTISWHGKDALLWIGRDVTDRRSEGTTVVATGITLPSSVVTPVAESLRAPAGRNELLARNVAQRNNRPWHENRDDLEEIQMLGDEVRSASEDLLYLTRIADGTLDIRRTETTVGRILSGVLPRLQRVARAHEAEILSVQVDEEAPLFTDARLLMRALRGFIERPLQSTGVTVTLTATLSGDCVRFVIIDSAAVNDESILEQVLQPDSVSKAQSGEFILPQIEHLPTMLSVHLFRALGGHVELQSSPGMGTQVTLTLLS